MGRALRGELVSHADDHDSAFSLAPCSGPGPLELVREARPDTNDKSGLARRYSLLIKPDCDACSRFLKISLQASFQGSVVKSSLIGELSGIDFSHPSVSTGPSNLSGAG